MLATTRSATWPISSPVRKASLPRRRCFANVGRGPRRLSRAGRQPSRHQGRPLVTQRQPRPRGTLIADGVPGPKLGPVTFQNLQAPERHGPVLFRAQLGAGKLYASNTLENNSLGLFKANAVTRMTSLVNTSRNFEMTRRSSWHSATSTRAPRPASWASDADRRHCRRANGSPDAFLGLGAPA